jgi:chemotaxis protein CheC
MKTALSELDRDALTELVNIGVGRAAAALRQLIQQPVQLSVPAIEIASKSKAAALLAQQHEELFTAVRQDFHGPLSGRSFLIFPQSHGQKLAWAILGDDVLADEVDGLEEEVLAETGNILLNSFLGSIANELKRTLRLSTPVVTHGDSDLLFKGGLIPEDASIVLILYINFLVQNLNIRGYIAMVMDVTSLDALQNLIKEFVASILDF